MQKTKQKKIHPIWSNMQLETYMCIFQGKKETALTFRHNKPDKAEFGYIQQTSWSDRES